MGVDLENKKSRQRNPKNRCDSNAIQTLRLK